MHTWRKVKVSFVAFWLKWEIFVEKEEKTDVTRLFMGVFAFGPEFQQRHKSCHKHKHLASSLAGTFKHKQQQFCHHVWLQLLSQQLFKLKAWKTNRIKRQFKMKIIKKKFALKKQTFFKKKFKNRTKNGHFCPFFKISWFFPSVWVFHMVLGMSFDFRHS